MNILIVDDSRVKSHMIGSLLKKRGYNVYFADTVSEASGIIGSENIGTVLVDFTLAGYNSGVALVEKIKRYNVDAEIYAISSTDEFNEKLMAAGCSGIISDNTEKIKAFFENYPSSAQGSEP